jgi:predicted nucleotidyltransferase
MWTSWWTWNRGGASWTCGFLVDVEELLGCAVDVVTERGLRERMRTRVLEEAVPL